MMTDDTRRPIRKLSKALLDRAARVQETSISYRDRDPSLSEYHEAKRLVGLLPIRFRDCSNTRDSRMHARGRLMGRGREAGRGDERFHISLSMSSLRAAPRHCVFLSSQNTTCLFANRLVSSAARLPSGTCHPLGVSFHLASLFSASASRGNVNTQHPRVRVRLAVFDLRASRRIDCPRISRIRLRSSREPDRERGEEIQSPEEHPTVAQR